MMALSLIAAIESSSDIFDNVEAQVTALRRPSRLIELNDPRADCNEQLATL
jgi:hypothetical protein